MTQDQTMKPETAAKKLGVLLSATPEGFRAGPVTRSALQVMQDAPPDWLRELRRDGPHPRPVVAARLGVSIAGLKRGDADDALTTAQIQRLLAEPPAWLVEERAVHARVVSENARVKRLHAAKA